LENEAPEDRRNQMNYHLPFHSRRALQMGLGLLGLVGTMLTGGRAAEVWLKDGGHLLGEIVRQGDQITVRSASLGEVRVPVASVARIVGEPPLPAAPPKAPDAAESATKPADTSVKPKQPPWKYRLDFGYFSQSINVSTVRFSVGANAQRKVGKNAYELNARWIYAETGSLKTEDRDEASFRWRRDASGRFFLQEVSSYVKDGILGIDVQFDQTLDCGYKVLQSGPRTASIGLGLVAQYRRIPVQPEGTGYFGQMFGEFQWKFNDRFSMIHTGRTQHLFNELATVSNSQGAVVRGTQGRYLYRYNLTFNGKVTDKITAGTGYEMLYDTTLSNPVLRRVERLTFNVGLTF
jgi:hypothetical protein